MTFTLQCGFRAEFVGIWTFSYMFIHGNLHCLMSLLLHMLAQLLRVWFVFSSCTIWFVFSSCTAWFVFSSYAFRCWTKQLDVLMWILLFLSIQVNTGIMPWGRSELLPYKCSTCLPFVISLPLHLPLYNVCHRNYTDLT